MAQNLLNSTLQQGISPFTGSPAASPLAAPAVAPLALLNLVAQENALISILNPGGFAFSNPVEPEFTGPPDQART